MIVCPVCSTMRKKRGGESLGKAGCVGTHIVSVLFLSVVRKFLARCAPGPVEKAIDVGENSKCVHVVLGECEDRVEQINSATFKKYIRKNVVSCIGFREASGVRKLHVVTEDRIRSDYSQVCMLSVRMVSKIDMVYRPIEKPLMLPRLSRPYLPLMLGGRPPEKLRVFICSGYCCCAKVPGSPKGSLKII